MNFDNKNYYEILDIPLSATLQDTHDAYRRAKNTYSSDSAAMYSIYTNEECESFLERIEEAYSVLGDAHTRKQYDLARGFNQEKANISSEPMLDQKVKIEPLKQEDFTMAEKSIQSDNSAATKIYAQSRFGLEFDINESFEEKIKECKSFTGEFLKEIREYKKVSIERMSDMTKVSKTQIRYIEQEEIEKLPANVYTRGFTYQYAKCLKLNPEIVANSYIQRIREMRSNHAG